jgi:elongation factor 2
VAFGAALFGWAFTLEKFARMYSARFKIDKKALVKKLWGDNYYDASINQFITSDIGSDGKKLRRGFVEFIMDPIIRLTRNIMDGNKDKVFKITSKLGLKISSEE